MIIPNRGKTLLTCRTWLQALDINWKLQGVSDLPWKSGQNTASRPVSGDRLWDQIGTPGYFSKLREVRLAERSSGNQEVRASREHCFMCAIIFFPQAKWPAPNSKTQETNICVSKKLSETPLKVVLVLKMCHKSSGSIFQECRVSSSAPMTQQCMQYPFIF